MVMAQLVKRRASQVAPVVKNLLANVGDLRDVGLIPGLGRSPGGGHEICFQGFRKDIFRYHSGAKWRVKQ